MGGARVQLAVLLHDEQHPQHPSAVVGCRHSRGRFHARPHLRGDRLVIHVGLGAGGSRGRGPDRAAWRAARTGDHSRARRRGRSWPRERVHDDHRGHSVVHRHAGDARYCAGPCVRPHGSTDHFGVSARLCGARSRQGREHPGARLLPTRRLSRPAFPAEPSAVRRRRIRSRRLAESGDSRGIASRPRRDDRVRDQRHLGRVRRDHPQRSARRRSGQLRAVKLARRDRRRRHRRQLAQRRLWNLRRDGGRRARDHQHQQRARDSRRFPLLGPGRGRPDHPRGRDDRPARKGRARRAPARSAPHRGL